MSNTQNQEHLTGPWVAVLSDRDGFVYESFAVALEELGAEHDEPMEISVRRGTAAPVKQPGSLRTTGSYSSGDLAYELDDVWLVDPDDASVGAEARYAQAQAMAAGLNAASEAASAPVHHTTVSPVDDPHLGPDFCPI